MAKVYIHPNPNLGGTNAAYFATETANVGRQALSYFNQMQKVFTFLTNNSVRTGEGGAGADDYAVAAAAMGITTAEASTLWNLLNGAITSWNASNNKLLADTLG